MIQVIVVCADTVPEYEKMLNESLARMHKSMGVFRSIKTFYTDEWKYAAMIIYEDPKKGGK